MLPQQNRLFSSSLWTLFPLAMAMTVQALASCLSPRSAMCGNLSQAGCGRNAFVQGALVLQCLIPPYCRKPPPAPAAHTFVGSLLLTGEGLMLISQVRFLMFQLETLQPSSSSKSPSFSQGCVPGFVPAHSVQRGDRLCLTVTRGSFRVFLLPGGRAKLRVQLTSQESNSFVASWVHFST